MYGEKSPTITLYSNCLLPNYVCRLVGGGEADKKVHHMGPRKTMKSLSDKDAELFETFLRMCIQIVFLALGRRYFQEIGNLL